MFLCEEYGGIRIEGFIQSSMHVVIASENGLAYISQLVLIIFGMSHQLSCLVVLSPNTTTDCFCFQFSSGQFFVAFAVSWALSFFITVFFSISCLIYLFFHFLYSHNLSTCIWSQLSSEHPSKISCWDIWWSSKRHFYEEPQIYFGKNSVTHKIAL